MILTILASWALASDPSAPQVAPATPPAKKERMICRTMELTGTRMGSGRVCKRESEWRKDKEDAEHVLNGRRDLFDASPTRPGG